MQFTDDLVKRRRRELGAFLRNRRAELRPDALGVAGVGRRHVKGLRREEVAAASAIGVSWYTMLEQGRVERVTTRTLDAIAHTLQLTAVERDHLRELAGASFDDVVVERHPPGHLIEYVKHYAHGGAILHSSRFEIVAASRWSEAFFGFDGDARPNLLERMLRDDALKARFIAPNWLDTLRLMVGHFRLDFARFGSAEHAALADRLCAESAEFNMIWSEERLVHAAPSERATIDHPTFGRLETVLIALASPACPSYSLVLNHAEPDTTTAPASLRAPSSSDSTDC